MTITKKPSTSTKVKRKPRVRRTTSRKKTGFSWYRLLFFWRKWPLWVILTGLVLAVGGYAAAFYFFFVGPYSFRWKALYGEPEYPEGYTVRGIDISHYQDEIDWERVRNANLNNDPVSFVIIKATEGQNIFDDCFNDNFHCARENDIIRGAYHYFVPSVDPKVQARFYLRQVHLLPGDLPPVLDVEDIGKLSKQELQSKVRVWLDIVEAEYGVKPILYTGYKFRVDYLDDPVFDQYPFWIAHYYVNELTYQGPWTIWQHTDCGHVDGIRGYVDVNIFNGSVQDLHHLCLQEDDPVSPAEE